MECPDTDNCHAIICRIIIHSGTQDEAYFAYDDAHDACYTTGSYIWLKTKYKQIGNTGNDRRQELFTDFSNWASSTTFAPYELMEAASCVGDCACCIKDSCLKAPDTIMARLKCSSNKRRKRDILEDYPVLEFEACKFKDFKINMVK
jgi:hypothetical protein